MMGFIWFWLVAIMIVGYVVLDGFDLGVGVLHLFLVRTEAERKATLASIGPVWDGNEVWLLAGGGTLYFAFPLLYASAFSGFYLPLMIVLWLLVLRGVSLELRNHLDVGVWRSLLDGVFGLASTLLCIFLRSRAGQRAAWCTAECGRLLLPAPVDQLATRPRARHSRLVHGHRRPRCVHRAYAARSPLACAQNFGRSGAARRNVVSPLWLILVSLTVVSLFATIAVRPASLDNYFNYPFTFVIPAGVIASLAALWLWNRKREPLKAFLASCLYLFFMLAGACWGLYPVLLPATTGAANDITLTRAISGPHTLAVGLAWWIFGMILAIGYEVFVYSRFKGKADATAHGH
jgi:cytochrome d ubiquinol oxidase subunit II